MTKNTKTDTLNETYVELGFFGPVKQEEWGSLVQAVQNNIAHSRREPGNLSFSLYQPEGDTLQPIWFERFKTNEAHDFHMQQDYFKNAIAVIKQSLAGEAQSIALKELKEVPVTIAEHTGDMETLHSITLYDVKPANRQQFITTMADEAAKYRVLAGNLEYNLYQYKDEPCKFVLIEGWESEGHYDGKLQPVRASVFASEPIERVVKDISQ